MKEFTTAYEELLDEQEGTPPEEKVAKFMLDGREMHAFPPLEGQLAFMMAAMGRGQSSDQRFAAIINIMLSCLREDDRDYMEARLLTRDPKKRLPIKMLEGIFEHLTEEWFGRPTKQPSDSASSPPTDGPN